MAIQDLKTGKIIGQESADKNPAWKGSEATVGSIHCWIRDNFEPELNCEICGVENNGTVTFDWSNKDHKYTRIRSDWQHVCRGCHNKYDYKYNGRVKGGMKKRFIFNETNPFICISCLRHNLKHKSKGLCSSCYGKQF